MAIIYYEGAELPDVEITWLDPDGNVINFASGYTFAVRIGIAGESAQVTKTSGINGAAAAPNITISWDAGELDALNPGEYDLDIIATDGSGKDRIQSTTLTILAAVAA